VVSERSDPDEGLVGIVAIRTLSLWRLIAMVAAARMR
jgi:hypothetical protein